MKLINNLGKNSPLFVWNGVAMFIGSSLNTDPHKHDCVQLTIDLKAQFLMKGRDKEWGTYSSCIISSDYYHQLDSNGSHQLFIYLDKETSLAQILQKKHLATEPIASLDLKASTINPDHLVKMMTKQQCSDWYNLSQDILQQVLGKKQKINSDTRVEMVVTEVMEMDYFPDNMISVLASKACLSESRLRHLFKEHTGQSIKSFILWTKVLRSLDLIVKGETIISASRKAGFWDGAHFDKTMNKLLAISPGSIEGFSDSFNMKVCDKKNFHMSTYILT